jgi:hypothetical protein
MFIIEVKYKSQTNESATVAKTKIFPQLNKAKVTISYFFQLHPTHDFVRGEEKQLHL